MKLPRFNLFVLLLLASFSLTAQNYQYDWSFAIGGFNDDMAYDIASDADNNTYSAGYFKNTAYFNTSLAQDSFVSDGSSEGYVTKVNTAGEIVWAKAFFGLGIDEAHLVQVDRFNNVWVTGIYILDIDLDPGNDTLEFNTNGFQEAFIVKLNNDGELLWATTLPGSGSSSCEIRAMDFDADGNLLFTGHFTDSVDFEPGEDSTHLTSNGGWDAFLGKIDNAGNLLWVKSFGGPGFDFTKGLAIDAANNIYVTGAFRDSVDFDPDTNNTVLYTSLGGQDMFISKYSADGNMLWTNHTGSADTDFGNSLNVDANGDLLSLIYFNGSLDFDAGTGGDITSDGSFDFAVIKWDTSGSFIWAKSMGGVDADFGNDLASDSLGRIYTCGNFKSTADFDPGAGDSIHSANGNEDFFVSVLDTDGNYLHSFTLGGTGFDRANAITVNNAGDIFITGRFDDTVDFDLGVDTSAHISLGSWEAFIAMYSLEELPNTVQTNTIQKLDVYPNPASSFIYLEGEKGMVNIYNLNGQLVKFYEAKDKGKIKLEIELEDGAYLLQTTNSRGAQKYSKFVIKK